MKSTFCAMLILLVLVATGCSTSGQEHEMEAGAEAKAETEAEQPQKEGLQWSIPAGRNWVTANAQYAEGKYVINEFVPEGETSQKWSELLTIQNVAGTRGSPEFFLEQLKAIRERTCPGSTTWNVIDQDERSILYEWRAKPCMGFPDQHEISRILDGNWNRFRIAYTAKVKEIPPKKRSTWIQSMSEASVKLEQP